MGNKFLTTTRIVDFMCILGLKCTFSNLIDSLDPPITQCALHTFQPMFQTVLHHDKELLERCVVRVKCASQVESRLDQALDAQFGHVHQVKPFDCDGILRI